MKSIKDYYTIKLHDTDAAGILFFANQFKMAHDLDEHFLAQNGFPFRDIFADQKFLIPIVHAEADYRQTLTAGDTVEIELTVEKIGETSFTLAYHIVDLDGKLVGSAKTVHVIIDPKTRKKMPLPEDLRKMLQEYHTV